MNITLTKDSNKEDITNALLHLKGWLNDLKTGKAKDIFLASRSASEDKPQFNLLYEKTEVYEQIYNRLFEYSEGQMLKRWEVIASVEIFLNCIAPEMANAFEWHYAEYYYNPDAYDLFKNANVSGKIPSEKWITLDIYKSKENKPFIKFLEKNGHAWDKKSLRGQIPNIKLKNI